MSTAAISKTRAAVRKLGETAKPPTAKLLAKPSTTKAPPFTPTPKAEQVSEKLVKKAKKATESVAGNKGVIHEIPVELAQCADLLYQTQQQRFELNKQIEALQSLETCLTTKIINQLPKSSATGISGKFANVSLTKKEVLQVKDWNLYYDYLVSEFNKEKRKKNGQEYGVFSLLQKRAGDTAIKERVLAGQKVPGVESFSAVGVSIKKV
jgi:hypothetical protein